MRQRLDDPTNDTLPHPAGLFVVLIGLVANTFQFNLVLHSGSGQDVVFMQEPDPAVTLQTGLSCRDGPEQEHRHPQHPPSEPQVRR